MYQTRGGIFFSKLMLVFAQGTLFWLYISKCVAVIIYKQTSICSRYKPDTISMLLTLINNLCYGRLSELLVLVLCFLNCQLKVRKLTCYSLIQGQTEILEAIFHLLFFLQSVWSISMNEILTVQKELNHAMTHTMFVKLAQNKRQKIL